MEPSPSDAESGYAFVERSISIGWTQGWWASLVLVVIKTAAPFALLAFQLVRDPCPTLPSALTRCQRDADALNA
jgi:hypothetical protein